MNVRLCARERDDRRRASTWISANWIVRRQAAKHRPRNLLARNTLLCRAMPSRRAPCLAAEALWILAVHHLPKQNVTSFSFKPVVLVCARSKATCLLLSTLCAPSVRSRHATRQVPSKRNHASCRSICSARPSCSSRRAAPSSADVTVDSCLWLASRKSFWCLVVSLKCVQLEKVAAKQIRARRAMEPRASDVCCRLFARKICLVLCQLESMTVPHLQVKPLQHLI